MKKYKISLLGCDDSTHVFVELSPSELGLIIKLKTLFKEASGYDCQPTMEVEEAKSK